MECSDTLVRDGAVPGLPTPKVVVGVDGTAANWSAVLWAVAESRRTGRPLLLVASGPSDTSASATSPDDLEHERSERLTADLLETVRARVTALVENVSTMAAGGPPVHALLAAPGADDLLVVGKRRGNAWSQAVLGSTATAVAGRCNGSVVIVPEGWSVEENLARPVVVGMDDRRDPQVLDVAFGRARTLGVGLVLVHAWELPTHTRSAAEIEGLTADVRRDIADFLVPWEQEHPDVAVSTESHPLSPAVSLLGGAAGAQLLVVGRHTRPQHPGGLPLGSTTRKVLHHGPCPVIVVPQAARREART